MLKTIIIMLKCSPSIVRRVNVNTLDLPGILLFKGFQGQQIVAMDEHIA